MLTMKKRAAGMLSALAVVSAALVAPMSASAADAGCVYGDCEVAITVPGTPGQGTQPVVRDESEPINRDYCEINNGGDVPYRCDVNYDRAKDCVWTTRADQPPPPADAPSPRGAWEECVRAWTVPGVDNEVRWMPSSLGAEGEVSPGAAAVEVVAQMQLEGIEIGMVPRSVASDPNAMGAVGLPAWMWVKNPNEPRAWGPYTVTREVEGVEVKATATVEYITWDMGNGDQKVCHNGGTPYNEKYGREESPSCGYTYKKTGEYTVSAITTWAVAWEAGGESGVIETITRSSQPVVIGELQAVNVKPRG
ncbi:hypothetical protein NJC10_11150 [Micrococcus sp. M4NT]|uniref:hypothetical protein n=1 Tax=Micrococcus sp. M4NT TaxID=2957501 RepID=UPI0029A87D7F|nr:hypothetical protein [Micrococcus sp. M4NT]MDX2342198.1 hypothetical protein [Micrococcus sp. M4NT]